MEKPVCECGMSMNKRFMYVHRECRKHNERMKKINSDKYYLTPCKKLIHNIPKTLYIHENDCFICTEEDKKTI